ncbi:MAG: leucine-rich repeat domain-containing protein, partial [Clostridia bacterium]|nr:leucine-rich repeat domain-containing protein [Clostridia bacterium]
MCGESELRTIPAFGRCDYDAWNICQNCHEELVYTKGLAYTILEENRATRQVTGPGVGNSTLTEMIIPPYIEGRRVVAVSGLGYNDTLVSVTLPDTLERIGERAFSNCTSLIDVVIPESVEQIGEEAFRGCSSLQSVTFSENCRIKALEYRVFEGCSALCYFKIPESIRTIRKNTFDGCSSLRVLDNDIVYVDNWAVAWEYHG